MGSQEQPAKTAYARLQSPHDPPLRVIAVGAGLGGCAAAIALHHHGHEVVAVLDKVRNFNRLGDSLGLGENAYKLLARWGCNIREIQEIGNQAPTMKIRRWHDGKVLAEQPLMDMAGYIGHRGDYHDIFLKWVRDRNIPIRMGCDVISYTDSDPTPSLTLATGETLSADIIVACDGIKSLARHLVLGAVDEPISSGYACFRAYFEPSEEMKADPARNAFLGEDSVNFWIGPDTHVVQNTLRGGREFNWILTHKDDGDVPESWFQPGDMNEVRRWAADIDPNIREAIMTTEKCLDWKICYRKPLPTWVSPSSHRIVLLGDSCHAHLPTSAQGASQATESAGVLAVCLSLVGREDVRIATRAYEKLRFPRVRVSQTHGEDLRDRWHNVLKNVDKNIEIDPEMVKIKNRPLYAFDSEQDAKDKWEEVSARVKRECARGRIEPLCD
ncbi:6-hydroxynicotinate 3-monooxygenase [Podospora australis]|uniref:6-hydroxynicotinate 3-monooxygenase n=1 Tax=Podospora australis TaxID=1536484 RepID=A0AAN6WSN7_9PEZI|nr:6-hydroxynicotinate 3-monooxygenase [Podospora australis]